MEINILEGISSMDQTNKSVVPYWAACLSFNDGVLGFVVPSLLSVIRLMTKTHLFMSLTVYRKKNTTEL